MVTNGFVPSLVLLSPSNKTSDKIRLYKYKCVISHEKKATEGLSLERAHPCGRQSRAGGHHQPLGSLPLPATPLAVLSQVRPEVVGLREDAQQCDVQRCSEVPGIGEAVLDNCVGSQGRAPFAKVPGGRGLGQIPELQAALSYWARVMACCGWSTDQLGPSLEEVACKEA